MSAGEAPIRLGLIGAGIFARDAHVPALLALGGAFQIVAVCSRTLDSARRLAALLPYEVDLYDDREALLARRDIEAVDIILPIPLLPEAVTAALQAGKHVISEKPVAPTVAAGLRLLEVYRRHRGQVWMVAENYRYEEPFLRAAEVMASGEIGRPLLADWAIHVSLTPGNKYYGTPWRHEGGYPGGQLLDGGIHHLAGLRVVLGEIAAVSASVRHFRAGLPPSDTLAATLEFTSGALGTYAVTYASGAPWYGNLRIVGEEGAMLVARTEALIVASKGETRTIPIAPQVGVPAELAGFAAAIRAGIPHRSPPDEAVRDLAVLEALLQSAEAGQRIAPRRIVW